MSASKFVIRMGVIASCILLAAACSHGDKKTDAVRSNTQGPAEQTTTKAIEPAAEKAQQSGSQSNERQQADDESKKTPNQLEVVEGQPTSKLDTQAKSCEQLSQPACLSSTSCELEQGANKGYFCRAAKDHCEMGFVQDGGDPKNSCLAEKDCTYVPGSCFCPEGVQCICGGGKPPSCKNIGQSAEF